MFYAVCQTFFLACGANLRWRPTPQTPIHPWPSPLPATALPLKPPFHTSLVIKAKTIILVLKSTPSRYVLMHVRYTRARWILRSPRWLIAINHLDEAYEVLMKYAEGNKVQPPVDPTHLKHLIRVVWENDARKETDNKTYGFFDVLKTPRLRKRSLILFFNW